MAEYPKTVKLKDETKVTLKLMVKDDLDTLFNFYQQIKKAFTATAFITVKVSLVSP